MEINKIRIKEVPTQEKITSLKEKYGILEALSKEIIFSLKAKQKDFSPLKPLQFKEQLLKFQQELESKKAGFTFPKGIGFLEYFDVKVPTEEALPELTKELYTAYDLMETFYKLGINNIIKVKVLEKEELGKSSAENGLICSIYSIRFEMESNYDSLMRVLNKLAYGDEFFVVDTLNMEKKNEDELKSSFIVRYVEFL